MDVEMLKLPIAIVLAAVILGGSLLLSGRYELVPTEISDIAWQIDRLNGDVRRCFYGEVVGCWPVPSKSGPPPETAPATPAFLTPPKRR